MNAPVLCKLPIQLRESKRRVAERGYIARCHHRRERTIDDGEGCVDSQGHASAPPARSGGNAPQGLRRDSGWYASTTRCRSATISTASTYAVFFEISHAAANGARPCRRGPGRLFMMERHRVRHPRILPPVRRPEMPTNKPCTTVPPVGRRFEGCTQQVPESVGAGRHGARNAS